MASLCKRQQCTIDRRGFRQELDSWRHKLIHCVGFESILEGLFGPELVEELQLFKDHEPVAVSDWSFDENCIFCCLRRDKVKEHLISLNNEGLEDPPKPLLVKDQTKTTLIRLERQAEEFLSAVFRRKDVPNFSDPQVPVVAREILQRMIRQFAAEYTSKTSPSQDSCSDSQPRSDQSLPPAQSAPGAPSSTSPAAPSAVSAHNQNPVLCKLLMVDQDAPLDLTIKKASAEPSEQDGVLDLSIKRSRNSISVPVCDTGLPPVTSAPKGEPTDVQIAQARELQSASTLEQFMAKLCLHHQRQIIDAIGYLQAEVTALASSSPSQSLKFVPERQENSYSAVKSHAATHNKPCSELILPSKSYFKTDVQDRPHSNSSCPKQLPETAVSLKTSVTSPPPLLDSVSKTSPATKHSLIPPTSTPSVQAENSQHVDHAPLKMKIMKSSNVAAGNKLSCVLTPSPPPDSGTLEDRQGNSSSPKAETHSARLSSAFTRHNEPSPTNPVRQRETLGYGEDRTAKPFLFHLSISSNSPRTARKSLRASSDRRSSDSLNRVIVDPDLGHCDIVYIDKPITECFKKRHRGVVPRRNARKSTRGHMYAEETWELKTVRTLAGRGNCPHPMLEFITSVTPKQNFSKPEGVPPVDMPCAGECTEAMDQQISTQEPNESELPETGQAIETAASDVDIVVETSQTDQRQIVEELVLPLSGTDSTVTPVEVIEMSSEQDMPAEVEKSIENEENVTQVSIEEEKDMSQNVIDENLEQMSSKTLSESLEVSSTKKTEEQVSSDEVEGVVDSNKNGSQSPVMEVVAGLEVSERDKIQAEPPQETQTETNTNIESSVEREKSNTIEQAVEDIGTEQETKEEEGDTTKAVECEEKKEEHSRKTLDTLLKEKSPCRSKKGVSVSKHIQQTEGVIVGFVYGKPVSASDRSLRPKTSSSISPIKTQDKRGQSAANKKAVNSTAESNNLDKSLTEARKPMKTNSSPETPSLTDFSSDTPASSKSEVTAQKSKATKHHLNTAVDGQSTNPMCHLRSSGHKPAESRAMPLFPNSITPMSPSEPSVTSDSLIPKSSEQDSLLSSPPPPSLNPDPTVESNMEEQAEPTNTQPLRNDMDSPTNDTVSPTNDTDRPTIDMVSPTNDTDRPTNDTDRPTIDTASPTNDTDRPTIDTDRPTNDTDRPTIDTASPTNDTDRPTNDTDRPTNDTDRPTNDTDRPTNDMASPTNDTDRPTNDTDRPTNDTDSPTNDTDRPTIDTDRPTNDTDRPTNDTDSPTNDTDSPTNDTDRPTNDTDSTTNDTDIMDIPTNDTDIPTNDMDISTNDMDIPTNDTDSPVQTQPNLSSLEVATEASKNRKVNSDQLSSLERPVKSKPQSPVMALRSKRTLYKETEPIKSPVQQKSDVEAPQDSSESADGSGPNNEKPTRMPLRSESSRTELSPSAEDKRLSLRSQRHLASPGTRKNKVLSPARITKAQVRPSDAALSTSVSPHTSVFTPKPEPPKQASYKFLETLTSEEYQHIVTNLNIKYDKMQKGWVQMDREGQPAPKYKNKSDRQAAIWKSRRRARKSKLSENQKYSPVQMLFMKGFDLSSICRWFLESTETKSLVIVKKVNTRLPSETQLCFHSSSASGASQGIFPSLQAERLKKHLKKFAIASPVKSNPKSQKLIAKALEEEEVNVVKVKELSNTGLRKAHSSAKTFAAVSEALKASGRTQNPASARILRKYSNIREKMQVQHAQVRLKNKTKVKANLKKFTKGVRSQSNLKASLKTSLHVRKQMKSVAKMEKRKAFDVKKSTKQPTKDKAVKISSSKQGLKYKVKKRLPKRTSQRLVLPSVSESNVLDTPRNKGDRKVESEKKDVEKPTCPKAKATKVQKESSDLAEIKSTDSSEAQCVDSKVPNSPDQVLTRSQSKMESPVSLNPKSVSKKAAKSLKRPKGAAPAEGPALTRSGALKLSGKRRQTAMLPRSASRKAQERLEIPAKRTRTK